MTSPPASAIRLVVLDIDGTLAGASNHITPAVLAAIARVQRQGIAVAVATGRMYQSALRFHQAVGSALPLLAYQGAYIQDPRTQVLHRHTPLPRTLVADLLAQLAPLEAAGDISIHLYINDQLHVRAIIDDTEAYAERSGIRPVAVGDLAPFLAQQPALTITKLLALGPNPAIMETLLDQLGQRYPADQLYLTRSTDCFFEATHPQGNKGAAVRWLAEKHLGLRPEQVLAIGDNFNDVTMLTYAGVGIAMGDAPAGVQAAANWVAPGVEEDGVAVALETWIP